LTWCFSFSRLNFLQICIDMMILWLDHQVGHLGSQFTE
jgi:hypothetical protein